MVSMRNVEAFLAVSEAGSFTIAARRLLKTQSAVSQAVRQLEEELGVVLIDRTSRQVVLTPAGVLMRSLATQLFDDVNRMASLVRDQGRARIPELRIGMVDSFATAVGTVLIRHMLDEAVNLNLWSDLTPRLGDALLRRKADVIVANDPFPLESRLTRHELLREPFVLLLPPELDRDSEQLDLAHLARNYPMIRYQPSSHMGSQIDERFERLNLVPGRKVYVDSTEKLIAMVASGIGWSSSTPISLLRSGSQAYRIRVAPFPGDPFERRLFMLSRRGEFDEVAARLATSSRQALSQLISDEATHRPPGFFDGVRVTDPE